MGYQKRGQLSRLRILTVASKSFLERGYSKTYPGAVCKEAGTTLGNLTCHFKKKEDLFAIFIQMLADFQWKLFLEYEDEGETPIMALCLELTAMVAMCEESEVAKDIYVNAYTNPKSLELIQQSDKLRAKEVFAEFCPDWTEEDFAEAEMLVSGIEYATLQQTSQSPPLEKRIAGAMNTILGIYHVPEERRRMKIEKVLSMDYRKYGQRIFSEFKDYIEQTLEETNTDISLDRKTELVEKLS